MDELDRKIVGILQLDGRASNAKMARKVGVSEGTVRRRLKRLIVDEGIQVLALPEPSKLGFSTEAIVGVQVDPGKIEDVATALAKSPEALNVSVTTGAFDLFAWVALASPEDLHSFLLRTVGSIPGVRHSETFVTMSVKKRSFAPVA